MNSITLLIVLTALTLPLVAQTTAPQSWTASDGRIITAKFIRLDGESVVIEKAGKEFAVPFAKLNADSVALAKKLGGVTSSSVVSNPAASYPETLSEPMKVDSLAVLPDGGVIVTGSGAVAKEKTGEGAPAQSYLWAPDSKQWQLLQQTGMWFLDGLQVCPSNTNRLLLHGRDGFVSDDGGKAWKQAFPQFPTIDGKELQIGQAFWSFKKPDTLLLVQIGGEKSCAVLELDLPTGKISPLSTTENFFSLYARVGEKHFGWLGPTDDRPIKCVVSEDDGKTWDPVDVTQTPWALHAAAQAQIEQLVPESKPTKASRPAVHWAFEIGGTAFCRIECLVGEKFDASQQMIFTSADHGKTWVPAPLDKRTADVRTLFAESPFVSKDPAGKLRCARFLDQGQTNKP